jgi:hypothetical protein
MAQSILIFLIYKCFASHIGSARGLVLIPVFFSCVLGYAFDSRWKRVDKKWLESSNYHLSASAGGAFGTIVFGADTVERAEKWHLLMQNAIAQLSGRSVVVAAAPLSPSMMLNSSDLWLRGAAWVPNGSLIAGTQVWGCVQDLAPGRVLKVQSVFDTEASVVAKHLKNSFGPMSIVEALSDASDVVYWQPR